MSVSRPGRPGWHAPLAWRDTVSARGTAVARLRDLDADLLSHASATLTLERWAEAHRLATSGPRLRAVLHRDRLASPPSGLRERLRVGSEERVVTRRVSLVYGDLTLSEADNWYVPSRLTPEMNAQLEQTETPFGRVILALGFTRRLISAERLWVPRFAGRPGAALAIPPHVLRHRALLLGPEDAPLAEVREMYTAAALGLPPSGAARRGPDFAQGMAAPLAWGRQAA